MPARQEHLDLSIFAQVTLHLGLPLIELEADVLFVKFRMEATYFMVLPALMSAYVSPVHTLATLVLF